MPANETGSVERNALPPSMLDLIRLSPKRLFPPGGIELYRQIALLTGMTGDHDVLDVACGRGVSLEYFVTEFGVQGSGVDTDPVLIELAERRTRELGIANRLQFQTGRADALPYRDEIFDITLGEIGVASWCDPADALRELARVTKPGGFIVLVQLVWKAPVDEERQQVLSAHLGARPRMVVEWKRLLREAGVAELHTEDWSDARTSFRSTVSKPFPDFSELFSLGEKVGIMRRAWRQWGWRGVWNTLARERAVHNLLTRERILGLDLVRGRKPAGEIEDESRPKNVTADSTRDAGATSAPEDAVDGVGEGSVEPDTDQPDAEAAAGVDTRGLPLFGEARETRDG